MLPTAVAAFAAVAYWRLPFVDLGAIVGIPIDLSEGEILGIVEVSLRPTSLPKGSNEIIYLELSPPIFQKEATQGKG